MKVWYELTGGTEKLISDDDLIMVLATQFAMPIEEAQTFVDLLPIGHRMGGGGREFELRDEQP